MGVRMGTSTVPGTSAADVNEEHLTDAPGVRRKSSPLGKYRGRHSGDGETLEVSKTLEETRGSVQPEGHSMSQEGRDGTFVTFVIFVGGQTDLWLVGILVHGKGKFAHLEPTTRETEVRFQSPVSQRSLRFPMLC